MTPQEKAKELKLKYDIKHYIKFNNSREDSKGLPVSMYDDQIKESILLCITEVINELFDGREIPTAHNNERIKYWMEVRKEIEKI